MAKAVPKLVNEAALFGQMAQGDEKAFEAIYHHYSPRIHAYTLKMTRSDWLADEITQDVFVQLWLNRAYMADVQHYTSYLFNMAVNKTLNAQKKIVHSGRLLDRIASRSTEYGDDTEERVLFRESTRLVEQAVAALPAQRRLIYQLSREEGLTHEQIARRLRLSKNTVKNQLVHALRHIRNFMEKHATLLPYVIFCLLNQ